MADIGWITGHSYVVYGPLFNGGTTVLFESTPVYPDPGRLTKYYFLNVQKLYKRNLLGLEILFSCLYKFIAPGKLETIKMKNWLHKK